jgi:hypothetical protein
MVRASEPDPPLQAHFSAKRVACTSEYAARDTIETRPEPASATLASESGQMLTIPFASAKQAPTAPPADLSEALPKKIGPRPSISEEHRRLPIPRPSRLRATHRWHHASIPCVRMRLAATSAIARIQPHRALPWSHPPSHSLTSQTQAAPGSAELKQRQPCAVENPSSPRPHRAPPAQEIPSSAKPAKPQRGFGSQSWTIHLTHWTAGATTLR